jgi:DNA-binding response OmpR family regulator
MDERTASSPPKTILVIDPDAGVVSALAAGPAAAGWEIIRAFSGEEGLALARSRQPDLLVLEALLPRMDGFTVARLLKSDPRFRPLPVVMVSARRLVQDILKAEEVGAATYVTKPFDPARLCELVSGLLSRSGKSDFVVEYSHRLAAPLPSRPAPASPLLILIGAEEMASGRLEGALKGAGFDVLFFPRAEEALPVVRSKDRVCVIASTHLPGMDGYTFCLLIKFDARCRHIPIFLLSSRSHPYEPERGKTVQADGHLVSSGDPGELIRLLTEAMKKSLRDKAAAAGPPVWLDGFKTLG